MVFSRLKSFFWRNDGSRASNASPDKGSGDGSDGYASIMRIAKIETPPDLPQGALLIDDFSDADGKLYLPDTVKAQLEVEVKKAGLDGSHALRLHYALDLIHEHRSADVARKFVMEGGTVNWSPYGELNLILKMRKESSLLRVVVVEEDGDWWNAINGADQVLEAQAWYLLTIPFKDMYLLPDFPIHGDGKQDFSKVAEVRVHFDSESIGSNLTENTVYVDRIFLS